MEKLTTELTIETRGNLSGFVTIMMWSASALLLAMTGNIPAFQLALFTLPFPFIVTVIQWKVTGRQWAQYFQLPFWYYALGTLGIGGYTVLWYLGFKYAPVFQANLLNYMWPFLILIFTAILFKKRMSVKEVLGSILAFVGLGILFYEENTFAGSFNSEHLFGYLCAFSGAVVWALYSTLSKKTAGFGSEVISICCLISGIPILIAHLTFETFVIPQGIEWIGVIGLLLTRVSYLFWNFAMKFGQTSIVVGISYFTPIFSSIFLILYDSSSHVGISALLVMLGVLFLSWQHITKAINPSFNASKEIENLK